MFGTETCQKVSIKFCGMLFSLASVGFVNHLKIIYFLNGYPRLLSIWEYQQPRPAAVTSSKLIFSLHTNWVQVNMIL